MEAESTRRMQNRSALFDWLVFIISFSMGFIYPRIGEFVLSPAFSWWMFSALMLYIIGAWLKHIPLSYRLQLMHKKREIPYAIFLIAGHWVIFLMVSMFSETAFFKILGMRSEIDRNPVSAGSVFIPMFIAGFVTWLVFRSKKLPAKFRSKTGNYYFVRELIADVLLIIAVSILSFVIWEKGIMAILSRNAVGSFSEVWFLFLMLSMCYLLIYLPLRYLYFIDDLSSRQTWRRMLLIFAFLLLRSVFEILRG
jgi:hypothetical protein